MLKIKDNVDLKELEKFGFVKNKEKAWKHLLYSCEYETLHAKFEVEIRNDREIVTWADCDYADTIFDYGEFLFDLIQAGLVEKVEE